MAAHAGASIASFMEEVKHYECLFNKFSKDYKNRQVRENCRTKPGERFSMIAEQAEGEKINNRLSYGCFLRKAKSVQCQLFSLSECDSYPKYMLQMFFSSSSPSQKSV